MSFCFVLHEARVGHFFFMEWLIGHSLRWRPLWLSHFVFFILLRSSSHLWSILVGSLSCTDLAIKQNVAFYKKDWNLFSFFNQKEVCNLWSQLDCERGGRALWRSDAFSFLPDSSFGFSICIQIVFSWGELAQRQWIIFCPSNHTWMMDQLRLYRVDVSSEEQLERYEQLFELALTSVIFGMGEQRSFHFLTFMTVQDFCTLRCPCFAVAVDGGSHVCPLPIRLSYFFPFEWPYPPVIKCGWLGNLDLVQWSSHENHLRSSKIMKTLLFPSDFQGFCITLWQTNSLLLKLAIDSGFAN